MSSGDEFYFGARFSSQNRSLSIGYIDVDAPVVTYDNVVNTPCDQYDADSLYAITAMDNCDSDVTITSSTMEGSGSCPPC